MAVANDEHTAAMDTFISWVLQRHTMENESTVGNLLFPKDLLIING